MSKPICSLLLLAGSLSLFGQGGASEKAREQLEYTRAHYTKFDYRIPMRDGVKLFTSVYVPKDASKPYPMMMTRTP
jgi:hypothetical protein